MSQTAPDAAAAPGADAAFSGDVPLVTFYVMAYRQEAHVREAVAGALAQTWPRLEIVLSDDASPDGTYEIMQEMAAAYDGPHRVILNRNPRNLGIARHIDRIVALGSGGLIVQNAGDDVSRPERTARLAQAWLASGRRAMTVYSAAESIDADGAVIGRRGLPAGMPDAPSPEQVLRRGLITLGATCAWSREIFTRFGPLGEGLLVEDLISTFRSAVLGEIVYLDEPLMGWRAGGLSWNENRRPGWEALHGQWHVYRKWRAASYRGVLRDLEAGPVPEADRPALRAICEEKLAKLEFSVGLAEAGPAGRLAALPGAAARSLRTRDRFHALEALKYLFAPLYVAYADRRYGR